MITRINLDADATLSRSCYCKRATGDRGGGEERAIATVEMRFSIATFIFSLEAEPFVRGERRTREKERSERVETAGPNRRGRVSHLSRGNSDAEKGEARTRLI